MGAGHVCMTLPSSGADVPSTSFGADVPLTSYADWTSVSTDEPQAQTPQFIEESEPPFKVRLSNLYCIFGCVFFLECLVYYMDHTLQYLSTQSS